MGLLDDPGKKEFWDWSRPYLRNYRNWSAVGFDPTGKDQQFKHQYGTYYIADPKEVEKYLDGLKDEEIFYDPIRDAMSVRYETEKYNFLYTGKDPKHLYPFVLVDKIFIR